MSTPVSDAVFYDWCIEELRKGWWKGAEGYSTEESGEVCAIGAMKRVMLLREGYGEDTADLSLAMYRNSYARRYERLDKVIAAQFPDRYDDTDPVEEFNDRDITELSDVLLVFEKARADAAG